MHKKQLLAYVIGNENTGVRGRSPASRGLRPRTPHRFFAQTTKNIKTPE